MRALGALALLLASAGLGVAQTSPAGSSPGEVIAEVRVHGNYATSDADVLTLAGITVGQPLGAGGIEAAKAGSKRADDSYAYRTTSNSGDDSLNWEGSTGKTNFIQGFGATSFDVGSALNASNICYVWVAFADTGSTVEGGFKVGSYTGSSGSPNPKQITVATGFVPTMIFNQNKTNTFASHARLQGEADDKFLYFYNTAENSDGIERSWADGFEIGAADNNSTNTYFYCCWIAAAAGSSPGGTTAVVDPIQSNGVTPYSR